MLIRPKMNPSNAHWWHSEPRRLHHSGDGACLSTCWSVPTEMSQKSAQNRPADSFIDCFFCFFWGWHFGAKSPSVPKGSRQILVWSGRVDTVGLFAFCVFTKARRCGIRRNNSGLVGRILQPQHEISFKSFAEEPPSMQESSIGRTWRDQPVWTQSAIRPDYWRPCPHVPGYLNKLLLCNMAFHLRANRF